MSNPPNKSENPGKEEAKTGDVAKPEDLAKPENTAKTYKLEIHVSKQDLRTKCAERSLCVMLYCSHSNVAPQNKHRCLVWFLKKANELEETTNLTWTEDFQFATVKSVRDLETNEQPLPYLKDPQQATLGCMYQNNTQDAYTFKYEEKDISKGERVVTFRNNNHSSLGIVLLQNYQYNGTAGKDFHPFAALDMVPVDENFFLRINPPMNCIVAWVGTDKTTQGAYKQGLNIDNQDGTGYKIENLNKKDTVRITYKDSAWALDSATEAAIGKGSHMLGGDFFDTELPFTSNRTLQQSTQVEPGTQDSTEIADKKIKKELY